MREVGHRKVERSLANFWERQRVRVAQRNSRQSVWCADKLPVGMVKRRVRFEGATAGKLAGVAKGRIRVGGKVIVP